MYPFSYISLITDMVWDIFSMGFTYKRNYDSSPDMKCLGNLKYLPNRQPTSKAAGSAVTSAALQGESWFHPIYKPQEEATHPPTIIASDKRALHV